MLCAAFFLLLFVSHITAQNCNNGFSSYNNLCACSSGWTDFNATSLCLTDNSGACTVGTLAPLTTSAIGEVQIPQNISKNLVYLQVVSPLIQQRTVIGISFGPFPASSNGVSDCTYPNPNFSHTVSSCNDVYSLSIDFITLFNSCGFSEVVGDPSFHTYTGDVRIAVQEQFPNFKGRNIIRTLNSKLGLQLLLPAEVLLAANITAYSPPSATFYVTGQSYDSTTDVATIVVTSNIPTPYVLGVASLSTATVSLSILPVTPTKCDTPSGDCFQIYTISIPNIRSSSVCDFSGAYTFTLSQGCRPAVSCPNLSQVQFTMNLNGDNVCGTYNIYSTLTGSLATYYDSGFSSPESAFLGGDTIYFQATLSSDVQLENVFISDLSVDSTVLVASQIPSPFATNNGFNSNFNASNPNIINFWFVLSVGTLDTDVISSSLTEYNLNPTINVNLNVVYRTSFSKRNIQTETLQLKHNIFVQNKNLESEIASLNAAPRTFVFSFLTILPMVFAYFLL